MEDETDAFLADPQLATTLKHFLEVDYQISGLTNEMIERLHHYQQRYTELTTRLSHLGASKQKLDSK